MNNLLTPLSISFSSKTAICVLLAMLMAPAYAQGSRFARAPLYGTTEMGQMSLSDYCEFDLLADFNIRDPRFRSPTYSCDDSELFWGFSGGWRFHENWSAEVGYRTASFNTWAVGTDPDIGVVSVLVNSEVSSISFGIRGIYFFGDRFGITGKTGVHLWEIEGTGNISISGLGGDSIEGSVSVTDDATKPYFGGGVQLFLTEKYSILGEYTFYQGSDFDASLFSGGLVYSF